MDNKKAIPDGVDIDAVEEAVVIDGSDDEVDESLPDTPAKESDMDGKMSQKDRDFLIGKPIQDSDDDDEEPAPARRPRNMRDVYNERAEREEANDLLRIQREEFNSGWSALRSARRNKTILYGTVSSIDRLRDTDPETGFTLDRILLNVMYNGYKVVIPFAEFFRVYPIRESAINRSSQETLNLFSRRQLGMASKVLGTRIPFVIRRMVGGEMDNYQIIGSRRDAMALLEQVNYTSIYGSKPRIREGSIVKATIVSVGLHRVILDVGGAEIVNVHVGMLTHRYVPLATDDPEFVAGKEITIRVDDLKFDAEGNVKSMNPNGRAIELEIAKTRRHLVMRGSVVQATVCSINKRERENATGDDSQRIVCSAYIDEYRMPAVIRSFSSRVANNPPRSGDRITINVIGMNDFGQVVAHCTRNNGPSPLDVH